MNAFAPPPHFQPIFRPLISPKLPFPSHSSNLSNSFFFPPSSPNSIPSFQLSLSLTSQLSLNPSPIPPCPFPPPPTLTINLHMHWKPFYGQNKCCRVHRLEWPFYGLLCHQMAAGHRSKEDGWEGGGVKFVPRIFIHIWIYNNKLT